MKNLFELINSSETQGGGKKAVALGIKVQIGENASVCPVADECTSGPELELQVKNIKGMLDEILAAAKAVLEGSKNSGAISLRDDMSPQEIWKILSMESDESLFIEGFNGINDTKRRDVADYVLSNCNTFTGKGAVISARYDRESGFIV